MPQPPHIEHQLQLDAIPKHVAHFESFPDAASKARAEEYRAQIKPTQMRLGFDLQAKAIVDKMDLTDEVKPTGIRYSDAINFFAKVLHEVANGEKLSHYQRTYTVRDPVGKVVGVVPTADKAKMAAPWDPAQDVIDHLAITDPALVAEVRALFPKAGG